MDKTALIIGRFQPIHLGHLSLIERYYKAGYSIKIGIGSSEANCSKLNPLSAAERKRQVDLALKEFRIKKYKVFFIPDIKNDAYFVQHVLKIVGRFSVIITGNSSILKLFVNYKHKEPWNIESFKESISRPGGDITSGTIRKEWSNKPNKTGLADSTFKYLKKINFSERLKAL